VVRGDLRRGQGGDLGLGLDDVPLEGRAGRGGTAAAVPRGEVVDIGVAEGAQGVFLPFGGGGALGLGAGLLRFLCGEACGLLFSRVGALVNQQLQAAGFLGP